MKTLTKYSKNGYDFEIVKREGKYAIAVGTKGAIQTIEVIEIQSHDGFPTPWGRAEPAEYPPSNNQWGTKGWTTISILQAETMLATLIRDQPQPGAARVF